MWHWRRYRRLASQSYLYGIVLGVLVCILLFQPLSWYHWGMVLVNGVIFGALAVTFAVLGCIGALTAVDRAGRAPVDRRLFVGSFGAGIGVFLGSIALALLIEWRALGIFAPFGVVFGVVTVIISGLLMERVEKRLGTLDQEDFVTPGPPRTHSE